MEYKHPFGKSTIHYVAPLIMSHRYIHQLCSTLSTSQQAGMLLSTREALYLGPGSLVPPAKSDQAWLRPLDTDPSFKKHLFLQRLASRTEKPAAGHVADYLTHRSGKARRDCSDQISCTKGLLDQSRDSKPCVWIEKCDTVWRSNVQCDLMAAVMTKQVTSAVT